MTPLEKFLARVHEEAADSPDQSMRRIPAYKLIAIIRVMREALDAVMREGTTGDGNTPAGQRAYDALAESDRLAGDADGK